MLNLFIDTSCQYLTIILEYNSKILASLYLDGHRKHTEQTVSEIRKLLDKNHCQWKDIKNFYITKGPGGYTGVKVAMTIVKTIKTVNEDINVFLINSLVYQAGMESVISKIDAKGGQCFFAVVENGIEIIPAQLLDESTALEICKQFPTFLTRENLENINYLKNFQELKPFFELVEDIENLEPLYLKKVIS